MIYQASFPAKPTVQAHRQAQLANSEQSKQQWQRTQRTLELELTEVRQRTDAAEREFKQQIAALQNALGRRYLALS